jgi:hypothetical protein
LKQGGGQRFAALYAADYATTVTIRFTALFVLLLAALPVHAQVQRVPIEVKAHVDGAPITMGLPFPVGALHSPDHVRLVDVGGREVPSQVTEVTTWEPADSSVKWIWVFFFADRGGSYVVEYGPDVRRSRISGDRIEIVNNQRERGGIEVDTGALRFTVSRDGSGFVDQVFRRAGGAGRQLVAEGTAGRGSIMDLMDDAGSYRSRAVVDQTFIERGTGLLHAVIRIEGEYRYDDGGKSAAPFTTRIHAYAGKPYLRVLHTFVYTGVPDQSEPLDGEHAAIATGTGTIIDEIRRSQDPGLTVPQDRIQAVGLSLGYRNDGAASFSAGLFDGPWWNAGEPRITRTDNVRGAASLLQNGPQTVRIPPLVTSSPDERIGGFEAQLRAGEHTQTAERAEGWASVRTASGGMAVGLRHFLEEYPSEITFDFEGRTATAYAWSPNVEPMSFARDTQERDGDMVGNFAQGVAKTNEYIFYFFDGDVTDDHVRSVMRYVLDPPVAHAPPAWYAESKAFGDMAPQNSAYAPLENALTNKFEYMRFNKEWEPWYGMFDYGDFMTYFFRDDWMMWTKNEPAVDYMWWLHFMRTGDRNAYLLAEAASWNSMDVGNVHWPTGPNYRGDTNLSLDYFQAAEAPAGSPYLGMGRRHARQHWTSLLSAHVWVPGWTTSYYLTGNHRALDVARLTAEYHMRRVFGGHSLTGRRLYLSVFNLVEVYDATKDPRYLEELHERIGMMIRMQADQNGSLVIDRYGYSQPYVSHGLRKYVQMTGSEKARQALVRHARWVRDVPPLDHFMESYLASIHSLVVGYEFTGDRSFLDEAIARARHLRMDALPGNDAFDRTTRTQRELASLMQSQGNLPSSPTGSPWEIWKMQHGLRVFGWTHIYNIPYLIPWLERESIDLNRSWSSN